MNRIQLAFSLAVLVFTANHSFSQNNSLREELRPKLMKIVFSYKARIGIGLIHIESGDSLDVNGHIRFPMQSVYKFPLALAVMDKVDKGELKLDQKYHVTKEDLLDETWSPLKKKFPNGEVDLTIAELLNYSVSQSDNIACDILFKLVGGAKSVNEYIHSLGIPGMEIATTEHEMRADWNIQYKNWSKPLHMTHLLEGLYLQKYLSDSSNTFLMKLMVESSNDPARIKALLPEGTVVAHKTGTSDRRDEKIYDACNDVGIIFLPDGTHLALSVFVSRSEEDYDNSRKLIAEIAKTVYDYYVSK